MKQYDLIVIGAGRASNLALKASNMDLKVALIEKSKLGGTCPNRGCVPSKLLIGYAHVARAIKESSTHYIDSQINKIDINKIFEDTNNYVSQIDKRYESRFNENATIYKGEASFADDKVVLINNELITADKILIATGTRPIEAPHEKAWTSDNIFPLKKVPKSITIVGSGFIACELANFFDAVGIKTKQLVRSEYLLSSEDEEIRDIFKEEFTKNVDIAFNTSIKEIDYDEKEGFSLSLVDKEGNESSHKSEALLYATGRVSNADLLKLENTNIELDERNFIKRNDFFETSVKDVYVTGDASGFHMLQHAAAYEVNHLGKVLLENEKEPLKFKYMPHAVFTDPEIASVGLSEQKAKELGIEYVSSSTDWFASARALAMKVKYPKTKFLINPKTYEILGAHLIGPEASNLMHQILAVMHINNDIRHLKEMLYIHPALSEAILPAAVQAVSEVEKYNKSS